MVLRNRTVQQFFAIAILAVFVSMKKIIDRKYKANKTLIVKVENKIEPVQKDSNLEDMLRLTAQF